MNKWVKHTITGLALGATVIPAVSELAVAVASNHETMATQVDAGELLAGGSKLKDRMISVREGGGMDSGGFDASELIAGKLKDRMIIVRDV